jgi:hypothetical protein
LLSDFINRLVAANNNCEQTLIQEINHGISN